MSPFNPANYSFSISGHSGALGQEALVLQRSPTGKHEG